MSIIAQVESSGTARGGGSGGSIGGGVENNGVGTVARNPPLGAKEKSGHTAKNHFTASNGFLVEASPRRPGSAVTNVKESTSPLLLYSLMISFWLADIAKPKDGVTG